MVNVSNIVNKGIGVLGVSAVLYDACHVSKSEAKRVSAQTEADRYEKIVSTTKTLTSESAINNAIQNKMRDMRLNSPFAAIFGSIKGAIGGFIKSLGDNLIFTVSAALALAGKGVFGKIGAISTCLAFLLNVLKEGFGVSKNTPLD